MLGNRSDTAQWSQAHGDEAGPGQARKSACGSGYQPEGCVAWHKHGHDAAGDSYEVTQAGTGALEPMGRKRGDSRGGWARPAMSVGGTSYTYCAWILFCLETVCHADITGKEGPTRISKVTVFMLYRKILWKIIHVLKRVGHCSCEHMHIHTPVSHDLGDRDAQWYDCYHRKIYIADVPREAVLLQGSQSP